VSIIIFTGDIRSISYNNLQQAASSKQQAASSKQQAASSKHLAFLV
jgi:cellobiose-specific phosphotransferase system component IIA